MVRMQFPRSLQLINPSLSLSNSLKASLNSVGVDQKKNNIVSDSLKYLFEETSPESAALYEARLPKILCIFPADLPAKRQ